MLPEIFNESDREENIKFKWQDVKEMIKKNINPKKAPGCDLITGKVLKKAPDQLYKIAYIFYAMMRLGYFPKTQ